MNAVNRDGLTALMLAANVGKLGIVIALCRHGANVNATTPENGTTALMIASQKGHLRIVYNLCESGANVNAASTTVGYTSLIWASENGHAEVVRELCARGANVNAACTDNGSTSLMYASWNGHLEVVRELCVRGVNVNAARTTDGYTSLMLASNNGKLDVVRELCARGANVNAKSKYGYTALLLASDAGASVGHGEIYLKIVSLLLTNLVITKELQADITETEDIVALTKKINDSFKKAISPNNPENAGNVIKKYSPRVQKVYTDKLKGWINVITVMNSKTSPLPIRELIAELAKYGGRKRKTFRKSKKSKKKLSKVVTRRS